MQHKAHIVAILCAALCFYFMSGASGARVHAQISNPIQQGGTATKSGLSTVGENGTIMRCKDIPEAKGGALLGRIVPCISYTIAKTTQQFSAQSIAVFKPLFYSFLVLMIVLFGVKVVQGEQEVHQQGILLLLKITLVIGVLELTPGVLVPAAYAILDESVGITVSSLSDSTGGLKCDVDKFGDANTPIIWAQIDCVLGKLYGFTTGDDTFASGTKTPNVVLASSMLGLLTGFAFGGTLALTVFMMCIGVLITIFMVVMRVALAFVNGYLIICLMLILSPIFLPLAIMQSTSEFFSKWWKIIFGAFILPVVMAAYAVVALAIYDKALFADDSLINKIFDAEVMKEALTEHRKLGDRSTMRGSQSDSSFAAVLGSKFEEQQANSPLFRSGMQGTSIGAEDPYAFFQTSQIEFSKIKDPRFQDPKNMQKALGEMFKDVFKLFFLAFLVKRGADSVSTAVLQLVGSSTASSLLSAQSAKEARFQKGVAQAQQSYNRAMGNDSPGAFSGGKTGADFVKALPNAFKEATGAFIKRE